MTATRTITCITLLLGVWLQLAATEADPGPADLQRLLGRQKLRVALIDTDYPPLLTTHKNGQLGGHDIELVQQLASELGVEVEFIRKAPSFDAVVDLVGRGDADLGLGTSLTLARAKKVLFSQPYMTLNMALLLSRRGLIKEGISELSELAELRRTTRQIGLLVGSAYKDYARKTFPHAELKEFRSLSALLHAVLQGDILAAVRNDLTARLYLHRHPVHVLQLQLFIDDDSKDYVAFAVHPDNPHLLFWLNTYLTLKGINRTTRDLVQHDR